MATPHWHANGLKYIANGAVDLDTDTIKLILLTSTRAPVQATDAFRSDWGANEATGGSGYYVLARTSSRRSWPLERSLPQCQMLRALSGSATWRAN
jgi:hypothetical protein